MICALDVLFLGFSNYEMLVNISLSLKMYNLFFSKEPPTLAILNKGTGFKR